MHIKKFLEWIGLKEKLHFGEVSVPHVHEGEIWWASLGENVGVEINGKSRLFTRPVLIFKKLCSGFYFVIPLTTQLRIGTWYVGYKQQGRQITACLHQSRPIDYRRLSTKLGELDEEDFKRIKKGFHELYV